MSDEISIPHLNSSRLGPYPGPHPARTSFTHSYRARRTGMDVTTKRLFLAAGALGFVLVAGMGAWSLTSHRAAGIPVIEADIRPLRVKPDNPGGMTAIGANEQIMYGSNARDVGDMAPAAEKPDPQALLAQKQAATPAPAPAEPAPLPVTPVAAPGSNVAPAPDAQAPAARVTPAVGAPAPAHPAAPAREASGTMVQIGSVDSERGATAEWQRLAKKMPDLLGDRRPVVQRTELAGKAVWRIRTGGFADIAAATQFCTRVRAKGAGCSIANF